MSGENLPIRDSLKAAGDLSSYQHCVVKLSAANTVDVCGATDKPFGILLNAPNAAGLPAEVARLVGIAQVKVNGSTGGAISAGDYLKPAASGVLAKSAIADKDCICGIANEGATADGVIIEVFLFGPSYVSA